MSSVKYMVVVPNVVGQKLVEAEQAIRGHSLLPIFFPTTLSNLTTAVIVSQDPPPGEERSSGSMVLLYPSDREQVVVPDVVGWDIDTAVEELQGQRLRPVFANPLSSSDIAAVKSLHPEAGKPVPVNSLILIHATSKNLVEVPDVVGWSIMEAEQELVRVGLVPRDHAYRATDGTQVEVVDYLIPPRGTPVLKGAKVKLVTKLVPADTDSSGVNLPTVSNYRGWLVDVVDYGPSPDPWTPE